MLLTFALGFTTKLADWYCPGAAAKEIAVPKYEEEIALVGKIIPVAPSLDQ